MWSDTEFIGNVGWWWCLLALNGLVMYGFTHPSLIYLLEQLPGAHRCHLYDFKYHRDHVASAADEDDDVRLSLYAVCLLFTGLNWVETQEHAVPSPPFLQSGIPQASKSVFFSMRTCVTGQKDSFLHYQWTSQSEFPQDNGLTKIGGLLQKRRGPPTFTGSGGFYRCKYLKIAL